MAGQIKREGEYQKLEGVKADDQGRIVGDFVFETQGTAVDEGFRNVSTLWYDQTMSIEEAIDMVHDERRERHDHIVRLGDVLYTLDDEGDVVLRINGIDFKPTMHALLQVANWSDHVSHSTVKKLTADPYDNKGKVRYNRDYYDAETLLQVLDNGKRRQDDDKEFRFRTYKDGTLRAMVTTKYAVVDNTWYLELLKGIIPDGRISHWNGDADTIFSNLLIPDTIREEKDSAYGAMVSLGNSEIGIRRFSQYPSLYRSICMNGCIWSQDKGIAMSKVHRGDIDLTQLAAEVKDNVNKQIPLSVAAIDNFLGCRSKAFSVGVNAAQVICQVAKDYKLTTGTAKSQVVKVIEQFQKHELAEPNAFGVINAITRAGQLKGFTPEDWVRFDEIGGAIMSYDDNKWEKLNKKASTLTADDVKELCGVKA